MDEPPDYRKIIEGVCPHCGANLERRDDHGHCPECNIGFRYSPESIDIVLTPVVKSIDWGDGVKREATLVEFRKPQ